MPETESPQTDTDARPPCAAGDAGCMQRCMHCRREVEASMSRIARRKLRKIRAHDSCSVARCVTFLKSVADETMRMHLASMAWWRFSADDAPAASAVMRVMNACHASKPEEGRAYMHAAVRTLSPLSSEQLSAWFGCENLYQMAALFIGDIPPKLGKHCQKCRLYKQGCNSYGQLTADDCPFWDDSFVQAVAASVAKAGEWRNPCKGIPDGE